MKGDFTRDSFEPARHFLRVLQQQGRVQLDADWNEQVSILLHYMQTLAKDLIGPWARPEGSTGFILDATKDADDLIIGKGHCYVDGILVENHGDCLYTRQPDYIPPKDDGLRELLSKPSGQNQWFWVYLDVWERHISHIEHDAIREKALLGPDTCTRSQVVWQVKAWSVEDIPGLKAARTAGINPEICRFPLDHLPSLGKARLAARVKPVPKSEDPCILAPESKYRGLENRLYRIEIHQAVAGVPTFKWSRENGSIATVWLGLRDGALEVETARGFAAGNWVELSSDDSELLGQPGVLVKLARVEADLLYLDPATVPKFGIPWSENLAHPKVRRWDQTERGNLKLADDGAVPVREGKDEKDWIEVEDGIQVRFSHGGTYRSGDYWLIPARVADGKIEWPEDDPKGQPPRGIEHHYMPLGFVGRGDSGLEIKRCNCSFKPIRTCGEAASPGTMDLPPTTHLEESAPQAVDAVKFEDRVTQPKATDTILPEDRNPVAQPVPERPEITDTAKAAPVTFVHVPPLMDEEARRRALEDALSQIAAKGTFADIADPVVM